MKSIRPLRLASSNEDSGLSGEIEVIDHYVFGGFQPPSHLDDDSLSRVPIRTLTEAYHLTLSSAIIFLSVSYFSLDETAKAACLEIRNELLEARRKLGDDHRVYIRFSDSEFSIHIIEKMISE